MKKNALMTVAGTAGIAILLTIIAWQWVELKEFTRVGKLESQVIQKQAERMTELETDRQVLMDELTTLSKNHDDLAEAVAQEKDANDGLTHQVEMLTNELKLTKEELKQKTEDVNTLIRSSTAKDKEIKRLKSLQTSSKATSKKKQTVVAVSRGSSYKGKNVVGTNFETTWYNYNSGATATGVPPRDGVTVAVDPRVIPLGTWIEIEFPNGQKYVRKAEDTGGVVKGHIIHIYSSASTSELLRRGRTHGVKVTILNKR